MALKTQSSTQRQMAQEQTKQMEIQAQHQQEMQRLQNEQKNNELQANMQLAGKKAQETELNNQRNIRMSSMEIALRGWGRWMRLKELLARAKRIEGYIKDGE